MLRLDRAALAAALCLVAAPAAGQAVFTPPGGPYDPAIPTVERLRGFATGSGFSTYRDVERVLEGLAAASDRVRLETYGASAEGRPLRVAWVSAPGNLARLDELRAATRAVAFEGAVPVAGPVFVWLSFGVHGDEASSTEAALELLYHLAASRDPALTAALEEAVIVVDPLLNPDGHERYVTWYRSVAGPAPDPDPGAREHRPPWPGGRTNHWYQDLNRDWAWGIQPETRARRALYLATLPQVHVDFHEMDPESSYFFFPAAAPVHAFYPPSTARWAQVFGAANAAAFDARGWPYFTAEDFDLFYPGYGDSWPSFFGATGMTYEQAGGGRAGLALDRPGAGRLTLAERVERHWTAAVTTIETAVQHREARLADFAGWWRPGERAAPGAPAAYLVPRTSADADSLAALLAAQGVEVDTLAATLQAAGLEPYAGSPPLGSLPPGTFLLRGDQPLGRYLAALMVPGSALPDTTSLYYDLTGWTLPYLYGVPAWRAAADPAVPSGRWSPAAEPIEPPPTESRTVALAWPYRSVSDVMAAGRLAGAGWRLRVATRGFRAAGTAWSAGSFVLVASEQPDSLAGGSGADAPARVAAAARAVASAGARAMPLASFRTDDGADLGSGRFRPVRAPVVAVATGPATEPSSAGAAWQLLVRAGLPHDVVRAGDLAAAPGGGGDALAGRGRAPLQIERYTAIVLPDGPGPEAYAAALGEDGAARLAAWVRAGGTLIGIRAGAGWLTEDHAGLAGVDLAEQPEEGPERRRRSEAQRENDDARERIPGTLLVAQVDTTSALGYGFSGSEAPVLVRDPTELALAGSGNAWLYADREPLAGYLPAAARARLPGTPYAIVTPLGRGRVVLFGDDPGFRGILHALAKVYLNAVLLVPGS